MIANSPRRPTIAFAVLLTFAFSALLVTQPFVGGSSSTAVAQESARKRVPASYAEPARQRGRVERYRYSTGGRTKEAMVYLPFGYDPADRSTRYDVLYLMHGGGGDVESWLGTPSAPSDLPPVLDHMIEDRVVKPTIVVAPTFDTSIEGFDASVGGFVDELTEDLVPQVETEYRTYAEAATPQALRA